MYTRYFESSKAWKVTVVWIECGDDVFSHHIKKVHTRNCSPKQKLSKVANLILVDTLKYFN